MGQTSVSQSRKRILRDLLIGACLGGLGAALVWHLYPGFWREQPDAAHEIALQHRHALEQQAARAALAVAQPAPAPAPDTCDLEPLIPPSSAQDGLAPVEHPFPGGPRARAEVFLRQAEAAAAGGRLRDAEMALLAACRENGKASSRPTVPLARVLERLGDHYAAAAGAEDSPVQREQLLSRAKHIIFLSGQAYSKALGPNASRSVQARKRLATLEQDILVPTDLPQRGRMGPQDDAHAAASKRIQANQSTAPVKAVPVRRVPVGSQEIRQPEAAEPSEDRAARASDPDLRQLASDLARLRAQAESVTEDPDGFRRRAEAAQALRDRCQDPACVRAWYAKRRRELLAEF